MNTIDDATVREWLDLDLDGELGPEDKARLEDRLAASSELRRERRLLASLRTLLAESRIPVRDGFRARVMSSLPATAWERQLGDERVPSWVLPVVLVVVFAAGGALTLAFGGSGASDSQAFGIASAIVDFFATTLLAGAGLLFATWRGVGLGLETLIADSGVSLVAMALLVVFLNLLFFRLLRRRPVAAATTADERRAGEPPGRS